MSVNRLLALVHTGSLPRGCTVEVWHFCLYLLITVLWWHRNGHSLGLLGSVIIIVKIIVDIVELFLVRRSYRDNIRPGKVFRRRLSTRSRLLRGRAEHS